MRFTLAAIAALAIISLALFTGRAGPSLSLGGAGLLWSGRAGPSLSLGGAGLLWSGRAGPSLSLGGAALAHGDADWIMRGQHRNAAGEWCCGEGDCFVVKGVQTVSTPGAGYRLPNGEFVPQAEAQPSPDGQFWRCARPDGSRRCFFAPPPNS